MLSRRFVIKSTALTAAGLGLPLRPARAASAPLRITTLKFGSVNWLIDTIYAEGLDRQMGVALERSELASNQALTVALQADATDLIVSDWLWAMRRRNEGELLRFAPYSAAVGAVMVPSDSRIGGIADLKGKRIGVAGSALDKSWLLLRAFARQQSGFDPADASDPIYGAAPLLSEQLRLGRIDAVLTLWQFAARLDAAGYSRLIDITEIVRALGITPQPPLIGFVWTERRLAGREDELAAFFTATQRANHILQQSDEAWQRLRPQMQIEREEEFTRVRDYFRAGIPRGWGPTEQDAAERLFALLVEIGGPALVGPKGRFDPATFWFPRA
jgi:NitT/TauT family transport system substrate-binding protein